MGGFVFAWKGKEYSINTEGGVPFFDTEEEEEAFDEWRMTKEGIDFLGPPPRDWSKEHYLDDRYPWDPERERRIDPENEDLGDFTEEDVEEEAEYDEPYIDWSEYEKCRYGCYKYFLYRGKHDCRICGVISCTACSLDGRTCKAPGCETWICGAHSKKKSKYCSETCAKEKEVIC